MLCGSVSNGPADTFLNSMIPMRREGTTHYRTNIPNFLCQTEIVRAEVVENVSDNSRPRPFNRAPRSPRLSSKDGVDHRTRLTMALGQLRIDTDFRGKPPVRRLPFCGW